jgi:hypothetical protein
VPLPAIGIAWKAASAPYANCSGSRACCTSASTSRVVSVVRANAIPSGGNRANPTRQGHPGRHGGRGEPEGPRPATAARAGLPLAGLSNALKNPTVNALAQAYRRGVVAASGAPTRLMEVRQSPWACFWSWMLRFAIASSSRARASGPT